MGAVRFFYFAGLIGVSGLGGCGLLAPEFAVPAAIAANDDFVARGKVVDPMGKPLSDVSVTKSWVRTYFDAVWYTKPEFKSVTLAANPDGTFDFKERGSTLVFTFKKEGYEAQDIRIDKEGCITSTANVLYGDHWPKGTELFIILEPKDFSKRRPVLPVTWGVIEKPEQGIELPGRNKFLQIMYERGTGAVPVKLAIFTVGEKNGLLRFEPKGGSNPMAQMAEAPAEGYSQAMQLDSARLQALHKAGKKNVLEGHEFFYFVIDGKYGKGEIHWEPSSDWRDTRIGYTLIFNPDGTRNLVSQEPPR